MTGNAEAEVKDAAGRDKEAARSRYAPPVSRCAVRMKQAHAGYQAVQSAQLREGSSSGAHKVSKSSVPRAPLLLPRAFPA